MLELGFKSHPIGPKARACCTTLHYPTHSHLHLLVISIRALKQDNKASPCLTLAGNVHIGRCGVTNKLQQTDEFTNTESTEEIFFYLHKYGFCICQFICLLKLICDPKINTCGTFTVIHGHTQNSKKVWIYQYAHSS